MASFKSHPFFYTSLLLIGAVTAGQAWLVFSQRSQAAKLSSEIETKQQELDAFARQNPFPSKENVAAVEAARGEAEKTRAAIREVLRSSSEAAAKLAAAPVPSSTTDAYFDIASYVERVRGAAQQAGITLSAENQLGFSLYASTGPERELIGPVFKQRQYADYLMGVLVAARPRSILSLQRERPLTPEQQQQVADAAASGQPSPFGSSADGGDYFVIDPRTSARVPGFVDTTPFRFSFTGTTTALRSVLNDLARFELPVVVRSVEVESLGKGEAVVTRQSSTALANPFGSFGGETATSAAVETVKPLVEQTDSRFVVTVEFISLVEKNAPSESTPVPTT